jgi:membrane fusion protein, multidrug efflux system
MMLARLLRSAGPCAQVGGTLLCLSLVTACSAEKSAPAGKLTKLSQQSVPVVVTDAVRKTIPMRVEGIGNVESLATVAVKSRVDGQIVKVRFQDGADVTEGQVLFEIDSRPGVAQQQQAVAKLASDMAQLSRAREQDTRYQDLLQKKFISADAYEQYKANLDSAKANVEADRAAIENARLQVEYATIRAPISGRVGKVMIQRGNLVKANDTVSLVTINQLSPIYVNFAASEQYLPQIRAAMQAGPSAVDITSTGGDGQPVHASGKLAFIDNTVDTTTGTIRLRASVENKDALLWPGQFVHATLTLGEQRNAVVVPSEAVQLGPKGSYVFLIDEAAKAQLREVVVDRTAGGDTLIAKGLNGGEKIVVDGQSRLLPGTAVTIKAAAKASS